jgi:hypothetical protein
MNVFEDSAWKLVQEMCIENGWRGLHGIELGKINTMHQMMVIAHDPIGNVAISI